MNAPDELRDGSRAAGWLNKLLSFVKMTRLVEGVGYRLIQTTRGTALEIQPGKGGGATGTPSWKGEWRLYKDPPELGDDGQPVKQDYAEGDMVIRGGEQVLDETGLPILVAGDVSGTWIARRAMSLGEAPGVPTAEETAANVFDWDLVARFATPTFVAKRGTKRITLGSTPGNVSIYLADSGLSTLADTVPGSVSISLVDTGGHQVSLRQLNVCQNGVMRKMIILASELFD